MKKMALVILLIAGIFMIYINTSDTKYTQKNQTLQTQTENDLQKNLQKDLDAISKTTSVGGLLNDYVTIQYQVVQMRTLVNTLESQVEDIEGNILTAEKLGIDCSEERSSVLEAKREIIKTRILIRNSRIVLKNIMERLDELGEL